MQMPQACMRLASVGTQEVCIHSTGINLNVNAAADLITNTYL